MFIFRHKPEVVFVFEVMTVVLLKIPKEVYSTYPSIPLILVVSEEYLVHQNLTRKNCKVKSCYLCHEGIILLYNDVLKLYNCKKWLVY